MKIHHQEVRLDEVLRYFAKGFKAKGGKPIRFSKAIVDTAQNAVMFELLLENDQEPDPYFFYRKDDL